MNVIKKSYKCMSSLMLVSIVAQSSIAMTIEGEYKPMICEGRSWFYSAHDYGFNKDFYFNLTVNGDTVIADRECRKIIYSSSDTVYLYGVAYEEDRQVFLGIFETGVPEPVWVRLYDFGMSLGERVFDIGPCLNKVDTISVGDIDFRRMYLIDRDTYPEREFIWVEGVGSQWGFYNPTGMMAIGYLVDHFLCCYQDDNCIFSVEDFYKPSVIGVDAITESFPILGNDKATYDLQGRLISDKGKVPSEQLPRGVYIRNGRKFVVK